MEGGGNRKEKATTAMTTADHGATTQAEAGDITAITTTSTRTGAAIAPTDIARTTTTTTRPNTAIQVLTTTAGET